MRISQAWGIQETNLQGKGIGAAGPWVRSGNRKEAGKPEQMSRGTRNRGKLTEAAGPDSTELVSQPAEQTLPPETSEQ